MKFRKYGGREYRVLAIAAAFFLVGLFLFLRDTAAPAPSGGQSAPVRAGQAGGALSPLFANDPSPSQFRTFIYNGTSLNGQPSLAISATCHDAYIAILIFPSAVDYRSDVSRAVYNVASPCTPGQQFMASITPADLGGAAAGTYYFFSADQGTSGAWYDPK